ncbi:30S ribosomal protein S14 type Z [Candidatus Roizmanbacteria bacterium RIFCSPHIGHO2_01_FULL_39_12b]|uniref:Small ribosomal subunit protein uS14 n=1 Tax=Candidatus Roizmanbacteria bacterium RIFCSPHIGHO2_01_FULL_39_12b TaxID=1802030 RepID=A0A1F7GCH1_9BACT|nr:MAG: 30S ribosomal protein S14 type Z [Candidatus Roizmanbacteria bacterium RIFCSPHIGHO2_01_FULL_39_12b]OGK47095.1 MAG: 30S ribosomal protein S14 type Z [Candidatus Roizmanbacteria bacterium RIFCSPLOWO2_01_FULL_39_19]
MAKKSNVVKFKKEQKYATRFVNRCTLCGRNRGYMRRFGICRICFREKALEGQIPGIRKISW